MDQDGCCVTDECKNNDLCPAGSGCVDGPDGPFCLNCDCGRCDDSSRLMPPEESDLSCCTFNDQNNCKANGPAENVCNTQNNYFPTEIFQSGNTCSGVEISATAVPNGCGCQPNQFTPCTEVDIVTPDNDEERCFICDVDDLFDEMTDATLPQRCAGCASCIEDCAVDGGYAGYATCVAAATSSADISNCLDDFPKDMATQVCVGGCDCGKDFTAT